MKHNISVRTPIGTNTSKAPTFTSSQKRCSVISTRSLKASTRTITTRNNTLLRDTPVIFPHKIGSQFKSSSFSHITPHQTKATTNNLFQKYSEQFNLTTTAFNDRIPNQNILLKVTNTTSHKKPNLNTPFNSFKGQLSLTSKTVLQPQSIPFNSRTSTPGKRDLSWDTTLTAYDEWFVNNILQSLPVTWTADAAVWIHNTLGIKWWLLIIGMNLLQKLLISPITRHVRNKQLQYMSIAEVRVLMALADKTEGPAQNKVYAHLEGIRKALRYRPSLNLLSTCGAISIMVLFVLALRVLATSDPSMQTEGILWFTDLTGTDMWWRLPVINCVLGMLISEVRNNRENNKHLLEHKNKIPLSIEISRTFLPAVGVVIIPLISVLPSNVQLYWVSGGLLSLLISLFQKIRPPAQPSSAVVSLDGNLYEDINDFKFKIDKDFNIISKAVVEQDNSPSSYSTLKRKRPSRTK